MCADSPGRTCGVYAERVCRNFCPKPGVLCRPRQPVMEPGEKVCKIPLTQGQFALVDADDYEELNKHKWCVTWGKHTYYACRGGPDGKLILMHREIMKPPAGMVVDHINLDGLDNRKRNLRNGTSEQNSYNRAPHRVSTGFKGVRYEERTGKYKAIIRHKGKDIFIGWFGDPIEAAKARDRVARELYGEFAYLNFPEAVDDADSR
ncbi:MAG: HNH endonuclease [Phycisphaerae bacterium]|nr:HNH endonuclease [Phycisphaerae bacterium]